MYIQWNVYICNPIITYAGVVELVDTLDLGSSAARCGSSSLPTCTEIKASLFRGAFLLYDGIGRHVTLLGVMPRGVGVRPDCYRDPTCTEIEASLYKGGFFLFLIPTARSVFMPFNSIIMIDNR